MRICGRPITGVRPWFRRGGLAGAQAAHEQDQRQHDVWGVLLDSAYLHTRSRDRLDERRWPMLKRQGEVERARALCEKLLCYASPLFPYAEEIDPHTGRHLGNFPPAFSHLSLINAVMHLIRDDERRSVGSLA